MVHNHHYADYYAALFNMISWYSHHNFSGYLFLLFRTNAMMIPTTIATMKNPKIEEILIMTTFSVSPKMV